MTARPDLAESSSKCHSGWQARVVVCRGEMGLKFVICGRPEKWGISQEAYLPSAAQGSLECLCRRCLGVFRADASPWLFSICCQKNKSVQENKVPTPLQNRKWYTVSNVLSFLCPFFLQRRMPFLLKVVDEGFLWALRSQCIYHLPTPCALSCCAIFTGALTLGLDMSYQGCQSAGTGLWKELVSLDLGNICLVKHPWLLWSSGEALTRADRSRLLRSTYIVMVIHFPSSYSSSARKGDFFMSKCVKCIQRLTVMYSFYLLLYSV